MGMFKKLAQELKAGKVRNEFKHVSLPYGEVFLPDENKYLKHISEKAVEIYERNADIKKFSNLVLSDNDDNSNDALMKKLFESGVNDPFDEENITKLAGNRKFLKDLGLL